MVEIAHESRTWRQLIFSLNLEASLLLEMNCPNACVCVCVRSHTCVFSPVVLDQLSLSTPCLLCVPQEGLQLRPVSLPHPTEYCFYRCESTPWEALILILIFDLHFEEI